MALSPMMQQYMQLKEKYPDCLLFFRVGDFYEMFFDDAKLVSRELELTLTGKECGLEERAPMCGVPHHAVNVYVEKLLNLGYKVKQSVNVYLRQIVHDLLTSGELPHQVKKHSIYGPSNVGSFKFCMLRKRIPLEGDLSMSDSLLIRAKYYIRRVSGSPARWFGLETSNLIIEYVPLFLPRRNVTERLERVFHD